MKALTPETRVGILTILVGMALLYLSLKTAGKSMFGTAEHLTFYMNFKSVAGVEQKAKVKLSGVEIGYIDDITLEDSHAKVTAKLTRQADIRVDSLATIKTSGLLGEKYIEIIQGVPGTPLLKTGETLEKTEEPVEITDMMAKLGGALDDVREVTRSLKNTFGTQAGEDALKNILHNVDDATSNLKLILEENRKALKGTLANFEEISGKFAKNAPTMASNLEAVSKGLKEIVEKNKDNLTEGITNVKDLTGEFKGILKENRKNLKTTLDNVAVASGKVDDVMKSVKNVSKSIENITGKVERGEGTVGKLVTEEEVYNNLNKTLVGAKKFLSKTEELNLAVGFRIERQFEQKENKAFATVKIQPREDKYYLIEVAEDVRRKDLSTTRNTLNSLLYTIMLAKRYSDITFRGGIMESSAGIGGDYHLHGNGITVSADIFNFSGYDKSAASPQFKTQVRWNFQKYLFLYAGGDELLNSGYRSFMMGGGILFDENDLKMALGMAF